MTLVVRRSAVELGTGLLCTSQEYSHRKRPVWRPLELCRKIALAVWMPWALLSHALEGGYRAWLCGNPRIIGCTQTNQKVERIHALTLLVQRSKQIPYLVIDQDAVS